MCRYMRTGPFGNIQWEGVDVCMHTWPFRRVVKKMVGDFPSPRFTYHTGDVEAGVCGGTGEGLAPREIGWVGEWITPFPGGRKAVRGACAREISKCITVHVR